MLTGLRQGSEYSLIWDMVDWHGRMIHVPRTKNEESLHVPLNHAALLALRGHAGESNGHKSGHLATEEPSSLRSSACQLSL